MLSTIPGVAKRVKNGNDRCYSTRLKKRAIDIKNELSMLWNSYLKPAIKTDYVMAPYGGLRICRIDFFKDEIKTYDTELLEFSVMYLLVKYGSTTLSSYGKFTIIYVIMKDKNKIPFTKGRSIVFRQNDQAISVYKEVSEYVSIVAEEYKDANVVSIMIRIYLDDIKEGPIVNLIDDDILMKISNWKVSKKQI